MHCENVHKKIYRYIEVKITRYNINSTKLCSTICRLNLSQKNVLIILLPVKIIQKLKDFKIIADLISKKATFNFFFISDLTGCSEAKGIETHRNISYFRCRQILTVFL